MIRMMCRVRLVDRVSADVLWGRVGVVMKIEAIIIKIKAVCCGIVMPSVETSTSKYLRL